MKVLKNRLSYEFQLIYLNLPQIIKSEKILRASQYSTFDIQDKQLNLMNFFSQLRKQSCEKQPSSEFHSTKRNELCGGRAKKLENQKGRKQKASVKQTTFYEALDSQLSQDILKEINVKNKILTAQLEQYKLLVVNMEKKIGELKHQNYELNQKIEILSKSMTIDNQDLKIQTQFFAQTLPINKILLQNNSNEPILSFQQIQTILGKLQPKASQVSSSKASIKKQLMKIVQQKHQLQNFVQKIWELKDKIQPGTQQFLYQLQKWVKLIAVNYFQLKQYKRMGKEQKIVKKDKP